jgi:hypothetical protein
MGTFNVPRVVTLCERVVNNAPSIDIWNAVYALVSELEVTTPRTVSCSSTFDTPVKITTSSQRSSEQKHSDIDSRILEEVNGCVYHDTGGFYEKYFEGKSWSSTASQIVQDANPQKINGRWTGYPNPPSQSAVLEWFWEFQSTYLSGRRSTYYTSYNKRLNGSDCNRQPDIFLGPLVATKYEGRYNWVDVRVIGELKGSIQKNIPKEFGDFCGLAREVFTSQPTRPFLHGFIIRGSFVELWVFDRSGPYSCEKFDLRVDPDRFIKVIAGYAMMSDEELGLDTYIKKDKNSKYIMFKGEGMTEEEMLYLEDKPIALQHAIICRGTTCYRAKRSGAKDWEFVVKFSWRSDKRRAEGELLQLAKERDVWGVARLFGYQDLKEINDLRQGLQFGKPRTFRSVTSRSVGQALSTPESNNLKTTPSKSTSSRLYTTSLLSSSLGSKRKRDGEAAGIHQSKRSRSNASRRRTKSTSQIIGQEGEASTHGIEGAKTNSLVPPKEADNESFDNRIFCCLVVCPPGRAIDKFESVEGFLKACRDAIKGHRSLYQDGKILHRDISKNNIIITNAEKEMDPSGMLIDLDLAKELDSPRSGARHRTGTMEFMAIDVLNGKAHTYRHDLESLFYVFLWVIIRYGHKRKKILSYSRLQGWYTGNYDMIARTKLGDMSSFEGITAEFPPEFECAKGLAKELRSILFGTGIPFTGTYKRLQDIDRIYNRMINAFERTIERYEAHGPSVKKIAA